MISGSEASSLAQITRVWHGKTSLKDGDAYLHFLLNKGTSEYRGIPGNKSVKIWSTRDKQEQHFFTVTEWRDLDSLKAFAGDDYTRARYYPEDEGMLLEFEEQVAHYECRDVSVNRVQAFIRQLQCVWGGGSWQGENWRDKLADVTNENAFIQPVVTMHSIAEIVWHCLYWRTVVIRRLEGDHDFRTRTVTQLNFQSCDILQSMGWSELFEQFKDTQRRLIELLSKRRDDFLDEAYEPGHSYSHLMEGIIHHDLYHLGQVGLVRKWLTLI